jgi:hypothetical protein
MNTPGTTDTTNPAIPTAAQLADARLKRWHQQGEALLTLENLRSWLNAAGLVLFAPRPQIASPAPTLVEAVLGERTPTPTLEQIADARALLGRLIAEGVAVPLNLLGPVNGAVGDTPDFVASSAVFSYVFTLRGDKAWKQPPATNGALKVSHLALATHEALSQRGALTAFDLTTEVGKEVTEAAVLRALNELWTHMRVLPVPQPDGLPTLWELASARFTKQIKAGANAGQPSALSALISLYLGQALVAAEDEIESFLSPLAPRSRIRDVIHTLLSARQLDTLAIEGRTLLHVAGELPAFLAAEPSLAAPEMQAAPGSEIAPETDATNAAQIEASVGIEATAGETPARITKFIPKPRKIGTGYLAKAKPIAPGSGFKPRFKSAAGSGPPSDRERRPFRKPPAKFNQPAAFNKPWEEEKAKRLAAARKPSEVSDTAGDLAAAASADAAPPYLPRAPRTFKPRPHLSRQEAPGDRPAFGSKPPYRSKPAFGDKPKSGSKPAFGGKPPFRSEGRPPRRDFARGEGAPGDARPPRKTFSKPGTFGRKREGFAARPSSDARPARRELSDQRPPRERPDSQARASTGEGAKRVYRKFDAPRPGARKFSGPSGPKFSSPKPDGPKDARKFAPRPERPERPRRAFSPDSAESRAGNRTSGNFKRKPAGKPFPRKFASDPSFEPRKFTGKPAPRAATGFKGKKPPGKSGSAFSGKPGSPFAKFVGNKKPFGMRPPARKFKPPKGESA